MTAYTESFQAAAQLLTAKQRGQDFDDLNAEIAERDTGRNSRFRNKDESQSAEAQRRRTRDTIQQMTALDILLQNDPEYAALYNDTMDLLERAEQATEQALAQAEIERDQAKQTLQETLDNASRTHKGERVFKDKDGNVWTDKGARVDEEDAKSIVWKKGSPTHETFKADQKKATDADKRVDDIRTYQTDVLGGARVKLEDKENPPAKEEVEKIQKDIIEKATPLVEAKLDPEIKEAPEKVSALAIEKPAL